MDAPTFHTNGATHGVSAYEADLDVLYSWMPPTPAPMPLPEAAFSLTLEGHLDGHKCLLTARGQTPEQFRANLTAIRGLLDAPAVQPSPAEAVPQCPQHGALKKSTKGKGWYCPHQMDDGRWCKHKAK